MKFLKHILGQRFQLARVFLGLLAAWSCLGIAGSGDAEPANSVTVLTESERADAAYMRRLVKNSEDRRFDFSDDRQYRFFLKRMELAGFSKESSPQLFRTIEQLRAADVAAGQATGCAGIPPNDEILSYSPSAQLITEVAIQDGQTWNATAYSAVAGQPSSTALTLTLHDGTSHQLIGQANPVNSNSGKPFYPISATGTSSSDEVYAHYSYAYVVDGQPCFGHSKLETSSDAPILTNLLPRSPVGGSVQVCVNRSPANFKNCAYGKQAGDKTVVIPIGGLATYPTAVDVDANGEPVDATVILSMTNKTKGGTCVAYGPTADGFFTPGTFQFSHGNKSLVWSIPELNLTTKEKCLAMGDELLYNFIMTLQSADDSSSQSAEDSTSQTVMVSSSDSGFTGTNVVQIGTFTVYNGCLAKGSEIEVAGGGVREIETLLDPTEKVLTGNGTILSVAGQTSGRETEMIYIEDDQGHQLVLSEGHPVVTREQGVRLAQELKPGDVVVTRQGHGTLIVVERRTFDTEIEVFNLDLGYGDEVASLDGTTMFANGILVGDGNMQRAFGELYHQRPDNVLDRLPEEWHEDYKNTDEYQQRQ